jgi:hypothetical protein
MRRFFQNTIYLPVVLMLLLGSSSCIPPKNAGIDRTLVNSENRGAHLSQRALDEYRKGNLAAAISLWKSVLVFDPDNAAIAKAIKTATLQQKNLEHIKE